MERGLKGPEELPVKDCELWSIELKGTQLYLVIEAMKCKKSGFIV